MQHTLIEYLVDHGQNIILSNGNTYKQGRTKISSFLKEEGYSIIMLYLNTDEQIILSRLEQNSSKDPSIMLKSKSYSESYQRQKESFESPTTNEADYFLECDGIDENKAYKYLHSIFD